MAWAARAWAATVRTVPRLALLTIFWFLTACSQQKTGRTITLAVQPPSTNNYPTHIAAWLGYFKEAGVDVSIIQIAGASKILEAVVGGSAEVGSGVYEQAIQMAAEGKQVACFVTLIQSPNFAILAGPKSPVKTIEDLKGHSVGVSSLGSPSQFYLNYLLARRNIAASTVSTTGIGMGATAAAALEQGQVDSAVLFGSAITSQQSRGARILADARTPEGLKALLGVDDYPASCLLAQSTWLDAHAEDATKIAHATLRALTWIRQHSAEEVLNAVPKEFRVGDAAAELAAIKLAQPMYSADGKMNPSATSAVREILGTSVESVRKAQIDLVKTYTNQFVN